MEKQFVPYELAVKLKELGFDEKQVFNPTLGFDEPCFARFRRGGFQLNTLGKPHKYNSHEIVKGDVAAPLWQQAFDWFREVHNLHITPLNVWEIEGDIDYRTVKPTGWIIDMFMYDGNYYQAQAKIYKTFDEAKVACLEKLIELVANTGTK